MDIVFLGHSSFQIKTKNVTLITDPFDPTMVGFKFPKVGADIVTISHKHADHNQLSLVSGVKKVISGPGEYEIAGVSIIGIASYHDNEKGAKRGKNTIYVIEAEDLRIAHLGDLGHTLPEGKLDEIGEIDILMVPVGGTYTIGPKEAVEVVQAIEPTLIIPMHHQMAGLNQKIFSGITGVDEFLSQMALKTEKLNKLKVSKSVLPDDEQRVVVLAKK